MTIEYFATRIAKHISVQAIWPDGRTEIIAVLHGMPCQGW